MRLKAIIIYLELLLLCSPAMAADLYVTPSGAGAKDGAAWASAADWSTMSFMRDNTYYLAGGSYVAKTIDTAVDGTKLLTIKKAGATQCALANAPAGCANQAVLASPLSIQASYITVDGNGTHTVPSNNTNDYGIKISSDSNTGHGISISLAPSNLTFKYVHVYNAQQGGICPDYNGDYRSFYMLEGSNVKIQNCYIQNAFQEGIIIQATTNILIERSYLEGLGMLQACAGDDNHGQAVRIWADDNVVIRWNILNDNDGQGYLSFAYGTGGFLRIYGNVIFNAHTDGDLYMGNNGGMVDFMEGTTDNVYAYHNTFVNNAGEYPGNPYAFILSAAEPPAVIAEGGTAVIYNNLFYNLEGAAISVAFTISHNAYGGGGSPGGDNLQADLASSIFQDYAGFNFRLASNTTAGKTLSSEGWWSAGVDAFFGQLDYATDMDGNTRSTWSRGAYEWFQIGSIHGITSMGVSKK